MYRATQKFKREQAHRNKTRKIKRQVFWGFCFVCVIYGFNKLEDTIVSPWLVVFVWLSSGVVIAAFVIKKMKDFWYAVFISGAICVAVPLLINDIFSDRTTRYFKMTIRHKHHSGSRSSAHVNIEFAEVNRSISANDDRQVDTSSFIGLEVTRGYLGYYIIKSSKFIKE